MSTVHINSKISLCVGFSQLINWGITYYLPGAFCQAIAADRGWSQIQIFSGLTIALGVMGIVSPFSGRILVNIGGKETMRLGILFNAVGCLLLAGSHALIGYYFSWVIMGIGMRLSLYDAAFATLVSLGGASARKAITQTALLGGLASVVFWPIGTGLSAWCGWRLGLVGYAAFALISLAFISCLPVAKKRVIPKDSQINQVNVEVYEKTDHKRLVGLLFAALMSLLSFLSTGISAHLPVILSDFGIPAAVGTLWGIGQVSARVCDAVTGGVCSALRLSLVVGIILPFCFVFSLFSHVTSFSASIFVLGYGMVNGLSTLVRATLPLVLFDVRHYANRTGTLLMPSFFLSALAPSAFAILRMQFGNQGMLQISLAIAILTMLVAIWLYVIGQQRQTLVSTPHSNRVHQGEQK